MIFMISHFHGLGMASSTFICFLKSPVGKKEGRRGFSDDVDKVLFVVLSLRYSSTNVLWQALYFLTQWAAVGIHSGWYMMHNSCCRVND